MLTPRDAAAWDAHREVHSDLQIYENTETGGFLFALAVVGDPEFWIDAFPTKTEAESFLRAWEAEGRCATE